MNTAQLRDIDLNLLVILDALLKELSVTRAADRLHLTPSAVSHALKRLRDLFDDELLLRDGRRMRPTVRAGALAETLPRLLEQVARTIEHPTPFDPTTSDRTFRLAAPDFITHLVPELLHNIHAAGPGITIELTPYSPSALTDLAEGRSDALIANAAAHSDELRSTPLGTWPWAVYARTGHPAFDNWSVTAWSTHPHLQVRTSVLQGPGPTDRKAAELGIDRNVQTVVPHFSMAAPILAETNLLLTVPAVTIGSSAKTYDLDHREPPFELPPMSLSLFRSAAHGDEPGTRWFLDQVADAFERQEERRHEH